MITLQEILGTKSGLLNGARVKLVRHKDSRAEYREMMKHRHSVIAYQKQQKRNVFRDCDYIISFMGAERHRSIFIGVFKVNGCTHRGDAFHYD